MLGKGWKQVVADREVAQWSWAAAVFGAALLILILECM